MMTADVQENVYVEKGGMGSALWIFMDGPCKMRIDSKYIYKSTIITNALAPFPARNSNLFIYIDVLEMISCNC